MTQVTERKTRPHRVKNMVGMRFGSLVVIEQAERRDGETRIRWRCRCDCGNETAVDGVYLRTGHTKSCGCLRKKNMAEVKKLQTTTWNNGKTYFLKDVDFEYGDRSKWGKAVRKYYGDRCQICGWNEASCDAHHRIPKKDGGKNTIRNGIVLCPNHHRIAHERKQEFALPESL